MTEDDLEPFFALILEIEQTRLGAGWREDEHGEPEFVAPTAGELLDDLFRLFWQARNAYDEIAAKIDGARPYGEVTGDDRGRTEATPSDGDGGSPTGGF